MLANVVGEAAGTVSLGEVRYLWQRGLLEGRLCGCGRPVADCPTWCDHRRRAHGADEPDPAAVAGRLAALARIRRLPVVLLSRWWPDRLRRRAGDVLDTLAGLYGAAGRDGVVVDSSKLPTYAALLDVTPGIDLRILHLVRDPRAVAFSWMRLRRQPDKGATGFMEQRGALKSAALWLLWNLVTELLWAGRTGRYTRVRYEAFAADPGPVLEAAGAELGLRLVPERLTGSTVEIGTHHTVAGNPSRMRTGPVAIRLDDEWRHRLDRRARLVTTAVTAPLLRRYGYRVRTGPSPAT